MTMTTGNSHKERFPIAYWGNEVHKRKPDSSWNEKERTKMNVVFKNLPTDESIAQVTDSLPLA
jgi:hypothetical protein